MRGGSKRATIIDIARVVGVSPKTVSRVLNDEPHVANAIRDRVRAAAADLHYLPNVAAQGLVSRKSYLVGLIYEKPSPSYVVELQKGALERLHGERYRLVVLPVESVAHDVKGIIDLIHATALDGVLLAPPASNNRVILEELSARKIAYARISPTRLPEFGPSVSMDDVAAACEIATYVIELGHRRIAIIKGDPTHAASEARLLGYAKAMNGAGIELNLEMMDTGYFTFSGGYEAATRLLDVSPRPTAILAQNDDMAAGAIAAARERGLELPKDLSVTGFDDSDISRVVWPPLTTIRQPIESMATHAMDMLLGELGGPRTAPGCAS